MKERKLVGNHTDRPGSCLPAYGKGLGWSPPFITRTEWTRSFGFVGLVKRFERKVI
jgi:hypothetical protein